MAQAHAQTRSQHSVVESLQSLVVAFVLAMTFRGFVTEGFVIPTGSMAPTLLGKHKRLHSEQTGWTYAAGIDPRQRDVAVDGASDPMLGPAYPGSGSTKTAAPTRMGDRILVLKSLYPFAEPSRYDVVVFKNPTNPNGDDGNYIKRLIGLPGEAIWLVDGDVFAGSGERPAALDAYEIQRKPEHVQRAVWQPIFDSDFPPIAPARLDRMYLGTPWQGAQWDTQGRRYRTATADATILTWDGHIRALDDWAPYNMLVERPGAGVVTRHVSDLRITGTLIPDEEGLTTRLELNTRNYTFEFVIGGGQAQIRMRPAEYGDDNPDLGWEGPQPVRVAELQPGVPTNVEFWHVDQTLKLFIDGRRVAEYAYDWTPTQRLQNATREYNRPPEELVTLGRAGALIEWSFEGSPLTLTRTTVARDLYYRTDRLTEHARRNPTNEGFDQQVRPRTFARGTHPDNVAVLNGDQFFMAGDNSTASSDSRLWGNPHPLVATQIDPAPFVVHRKLLLGKAWVVYFPSPLSVSDDKTAFIPDFGRLRFIR